MAAALRWEPHRLVAELAALPAGVQLVLEVEVHRGAAVADPMHKASLKKPVTEFRKQRENVFA